jgi:tetratricopeptide (TPR) repeat protein
MSTETKAHAEDRFEKMVTVLIATVTIWVAITAYFQNYAANLSDQARRRAQQYAIEATKKEVNGSIQYSYQWQGAFQTWRELSWQATAADQDGDTVAVERYEKLQERIAALSPMLSSDYFDPSYGWPDTYKYEADSYIVESTRLSETYLAEAELGNAMDDTADSLVVQITLLTVTLSLYGLSMALSGRVRWLFIIVGTGIIGFCALWLSWSMIELLGRPEVNPAAIDAYAEGTGLAYQGKYEEAIAKFDEAVAENSYYAKAYNQRGDAYFYTGDLATAITNYERARYEGLDDTTTNWNLGWTYYLAGQYQNAIEANERILKDDPSVLGMRMNEAISYLALGDLVNAQAQYDLLIQEAERQVQEAHQNNTEPSASLWYFMDAGALDLQNLIYQMDNEPREWTEAPTNDLINGDHNAIREFAYQQMVRIKQATTSLEYTGQLPAEQEVMAVQPFVFGEVTEKDENGFIVNYQPNNSATFDEGTKAVTVQFTYDGPAPKQIIWKVLFNGVEDQSLRAVSNDDISNGDTWYRTFGYEYTNVFILSSGEYTVELYADSHLVQSGTFFVQ